ncbi:MAG: SEL1-like repeat protein [Campylobacter sp.]
MGSSGDCYGLAGLYESGKGTEKSSEQAAKFYKKSCELGLDLGCEKAK